MLFALGFRDYNIVTIFHVQVVVFTFQADLQVVVFMVITIAITLLKLANVKVD